MKYSVSNLARALGIFAATIFASNPLFAADPHYTPPSENIKNFFSGTWEGSFQLGYAIPQSSAQLDDTYSWAVGVYHDIGSRMATEFQYMSTSDFDSQAGIGTNASFQSKAFIASLRGYGKPSLLDLTYFGRLGIAFFDVDFDNGSSVEKDYDSGTSFVFGFGAEKKTNESTTFSVELTYYHDLVQSGYVNSLSVGVRTALGHW